MLALIKHVTSGDVYVAEITEHGYIAARTLPLASHEYQEDNAYLPGLDLTEFAVDWPEDEPLYDGEYRYLATQEQGHPISIVAES